MVDDRSHLRPRFHVRPDSGWVNDPNGPVRFAGDIHLYFQSRPRLALSTPVEWGHAQSADGVNWIIHPSALLPSVHPLAADGVYSGNTVATENGLRAYFSGYRDDSPYQPVVMAESDDGYTFSRARSAVPAPDDAQLVQHYRDPFVWEDQVGWHMLVGAGYRDGTAAILEYASHDGVEWEPAGDRVTGAVRGLDDLGYMWECPQVISDGVWEVLLVSTMDTRYRPFGPVLALSSASTDTDEYVVSRVDYGTEFYAASVLRHSSGGATVWGWIPEARPEGDWMRDGWAGTLSLPRLTSVDEGGKLLSRPDPALDALRLDAPPRFGSRVDNLGAQFEFELELDTASPARIILSGGEETLVLEVDGRTQTLNVTRPPAALMVEAPASLMVALAQPRQMLRGFVDGSVLELFLSEGMAATIRFYFSAPPPWSLEHSRGIVKVWSLADDVIRDLSHQQIQSEV